MERATIAAVIPTYNVAHFIKPTLDSLTWCDEVVVVDMFSNDETEEICCSYPNVVFIQNKDYIYANVNLGVETAKSQWILRLDSDEVIKPELQREIENILNDPNSYDGYEAQSDLYFLGKLMRYGFGNNNWRTTLFKKGYANYLAKSEHEDMERTGTWGRLQHRYEHFTNPSISMWMNKINYYTDKDIERLEDNEPVMTPWKIIYKTARWFQRYYLYPHKAYKDGAFGFIISCVAAAGLLILYCKIWEKQMKDARGKNYQPPHPNC